MNKSSEETIKKWKKIGIKILFPHTFLVFLLFNLTVAGLVFIFMNHLEENLLAIFFYVIAFYSLVIVCVRLPRMIKNIQRGLHSNKYSHRYLTDRELRMNFSMYRGLIIGIGFAVFKRTTKGLLISFSSEITLASTSLYSSLGGRKERVLWCLL